MRPDPTTLEAMRRDAAAAREALADGTLDRAAVERLIRYVERLTEPSPVVPLTLLSADPYDALYRLRVDEGLSKDRDDVQDLITILEEGITSRQPTAQTTDVRAALDLTEQETRWLHAALGQALETRASVHARWVRAKQDPRP